MKVVHRKQERDFEQVFRTYYTALCYFAQKLVDNRESAEDLVENVFLKLWQKDPELESYTNIKALLYTSVKHACYNLIKKQQRERRSRKLYEQAATDGVQDPVCNEIIRAEIIREIDLQIQQLPPGCRTVLTLMCREEWDNKKIAEHLGITESTVRQQKANAVKIIRKKIFGR